MMIEWCIENPWIIFLIIILIMQAIYNLRVKMLKVRGLKMKKFTLKRKYERDSGLDFIVLIDESGKESDFDLDDLADIYGHKNIEIIVLEE